MISFSGSFFARVRIFFLAVIAWFTDGRLFAKLTAQPVLWLAVITFIVVFAMNAMKLGLLLWGICKLATFAFTGDWIDRRIFVETQPEGLTGMAQGAAWKRKGLIVAAAIVAGALSP